MNGTHMLTRAAEAIGSHVKNGSSNRVHAAIAVGWTKYGQLNTAESCGEGLVFTAQDVECVVFRNKDAEIAAKAAEVAETLTWMSITSKSQDGKNSEDCFGRYYFKGTALAMFRQGMFGAKASVNLNGAHNAYLGKGHAKEEYFCSEFVTLCHQVAACELDKVLDLPIRRDSLSMSPKALESYLRGHPDLWEKVGRYNRPGGNALCRWATRLTAKDH